MQEDDRDARKRAYAEAEQAAAAPPADPSRHTRKTNGACDVLITGIDGPSWPELLRDAG